MAKSGIEIVDARAEDAEAISRLINGVAGAFTLDPQGRGAEAFLQGITPEAIRGCIASSAFVYLKLQRGGRLAGVVALRDGRHLYHLFVAPECQRSGLARALWERILAVAEARHGPPPMTVNSTPGAVPVYERFGFRASGPRVEKNGIAFVPMRREPMAAGD